MKKIRTSLIALAALTVVIGLVVWPQGPNLSLKPLGIKYEQELKIHQGLDLQGGSHLAYDADMAKVAGADRSGALDGVVDVIERRVNALGVSEPLVQSSTSGGQYQVIVELPGVTDVAKAADTIGATVNMDFREENPTPDPALAAVDPLASFKETGLTGKDFKRATVTFNQQTGEPEISIVFNAEGTKKFSEITRRNIGKPVAIVLDGQVISAPRVQQEITDGNAQITGSFDVKSAKELTLQLNAGALPVPVKLTEQRTVGPTLGQDSITDSLSAGIIGLGLVALFMIFYYRLPGALAVLALLLYAGINIAIFKMIPVTLTLAGIAGFILSIGIAVDANILIFERLKEELRSGKQLSTAVEVGFRRAFTSIRDSNIASLLMCAVLYFSGSGTIKGFALVLAIGVTVSFFSAVTVTRTLVRAVARTRLSNNLLLWGLRKDEVAK